MAEKIALQGFDRVKLFPITSNTTEAYTVGEGETLPWVQSMTKDPDTSENTVYADDTVYLNVTNFNGLNIELTVAEMSLELWGKLGFGEYDATTNTLEWNPQGQNKEYGMSFRCLQVDGSYRMYRFYRFTVNTITESETTTKGDTADIQPYLISGTIAGRALDSRLGAIHDGDDFDWLDSMTDDAETRSGASGQSVQPQSAQVKAQTTPTTIKASK